MMLDHQCARIILDEKEAGRRGLSFSLGGYTQV
jgi:hypothetical protein